MSRKNGIKICTRISMQSPQKFVHDAAICT
ncbi:MAG TPA: DUF1240 domain-containing protein [Candidatus Pullichristensenella excrementigallinarum]|uniref:DUF1240 domain-containing protein n=1 Tax=Candidatus Pullichristensenella excrementigallinarum TaxID=2840907 RepID=A0A9D1LCM1_9FIRM|nr:DUF1240 domain-containing protein [Candidatus Pullichristensenella excrementigallinarum]